MNFIQAVFSPTGGTLRVAQAIAGAWGGKIDTVDLTLPAEEGAPRAIQEDDLVLIAVPSYAGRVPALAAERMARLQGNGARCVLVCVYGNRAYEDTLIEMRDIAEKCGFRPIAAVAGIAEHSILRQYAAGRPDGQDSQTLQDYGRKILEKFQAGGQGMPEVPGNRPYKNAGSVGMVPKASRACVDCGLCAKQCPAQAISKENARTVDQKRCISCMRCVANCPHSARKINGAMAAAAALALKNACSVRKECEIFL